MQYRVKVDVHFNTEEDAMDFINHIKLKKAKIKDAIVPPGPTMDMPKMLELSQCRHDEIPPMPCGPYTQIDWDI